MMDDKIGIFNKIEAVASRVTKNRRVVVMPKIGMGFGRPTFKY